MGAELSKKVDSTKVTQLTTPSYAVPAVSVGVGVLAAVTLVIHPTLIAEVVTLLGFGYGGVRALLIQARARVVEESAPNAHDPSEAAERLRRTLTRYRYTEGIEDLGSRALHQWKELEERFRSYERLLLSRLSPTELTFQRYLAAGEQAYLAALDNLERLALILGSLGASRAERLEEKLSRLAAGSPELEPLKQRLAVIEEEKRKLDELFVYNEKALAELERASQAVSGMKELETHASQPLEEALADLEELAKRAPKYHT